MRILLAIILLVVASSSSYGQGYTWEWSPRNPVTMPTTFVGLEIAGGYSQHSGKLPYFEDEIECCSFETGNGTPFRVAIMAEHWVLPKLAISGGLGVTFQGSNFTSDHVSLVLEDRRVLTTEYRLEVSQTQFVIQVGARQRLFETFLSVGLDVRGLVNMGGTVSGSHHVLGPDDYTFGTNPPSKVVSIGEGIIVEDFTAFNLEPSLNLQYDIQLATGIVLSPSFYLAMPLFDVGTNVSWSYVTMGAGLRLSRGL